MIQLSLDDAIVRGLEHNLALELAKQDQGAAHAQSLGELAPMLPAWTGRRRMEFTSTTWRRKDSSRASSAVRLSQIFP